MDVSQVGWIPAQRIHAVVQVEPALVILGLSLVAWLIYKIFLKDVSETRHQYIRRDFREWLVRFGLTLSFAGINVFLRMAAGAWGERTAPYLAFLALIFGLAALVKAARILVYEYLVMSRMRAGVPLLIVNLFSLVLSLLMAAWVAARIFSVDLGPLLATSALISVVIGLAMQDTLGNIFAGIALQLDWKPYEIGDWVEVHYEGEKWTGQVLEISWRATTLLSFLDERVTIPNRVMAQSRLFNFSTKERPLIRGQSYRFSLELPVEAVKEALLEAIQTVSQVRKFPQPLVLLRETEESWALYRLVYFINDFSEQYLIADAVNTAVLKVLAARGLSLMGPRLRVEGLDREVSQR